MHIEIKCCSIPLGDAVAVSAVVRSFCSYRVCAYVLHNELHAICTL
jgi:hypothetical protein